MSKEEKLLAFKVAATFLGTVVGAGFASGQEILQFFTVYRFDGFLGILISIVLFIVLGSIILNISHTIKRKSYEDFLVYVCGRKMGLVLDVLITVFLFGTFNVMLSATGALFHEHFGLPYYFGIIFTVIPTAIVVIKGIKGILNVNSIIAPATIIVVFMVTFFCLFYHHSGDMIRNLNYEDDPTYKWVMAALLYASYNIILSVPILVPLGKEIKSKKVLINGAVLGSIATGILIILLNAVILTHIENDSLYQIPMLYIVEPFNDLLKYSFIVILWLEIFTTLLSNLFGLSNRIQSATRVNYNVIVAGVCILSVFISRFDFKTLLSIIYPSFGFISLLFILFLLVKQMYLKLKNIERKFVTKNCRGNS